MMNSTTRVTNSTTQVLYEALARLFVTTSRLHFVICDACMCTIIISIYARVHSFEEILILVHTTMHCYTPAKKLVE